MARLALLILLTLTLSTGCSDDAPKVVTKVERVYPAGPPPGACEPQPAPETTGINDWQARALIYAASAANALGQLRRCALWIAGWKAEEAGAAKP
jgi:hypothetical protein